MTVPPLHHPPRPVSSTPRRAPHRTHLPPSPSSGPSALALAAPSFRRSARGPQPAPADRGRGPPALTTRPPPAPRPTPRPARLSPRPPAAPGRSSRPDPGGLAPLLPAADSHPEMPDIAVPLPCTFRSGPSPTPRRPRQNPSATIPMVRIVGVAIANRLVPAICKTSPPPTRTVVPPGPTAPAPTPARARTRPPPTRSSGGLGPVAAGPAGRLPLPLPTRDRPRGERGPLPARSACAAARRRVAVDRARRRPCPLGYSGRQRPPPSAGQVPQAR